MGGGGGGEKGCVRRYVRSRTPRMHWTAELHSSFLQAIRSLGGERHATPKLVLRLMGVEGLTIAHVKSHLQMYRGPSTRRAKKEMQPHRQRKHSCAADEQGGPKSFMCPPLKRARAGTEATYKGMQGSHGISEMKTTADSGTQYCIDDYMQAMAVERRIMDEGLRWQRDAAATDASNLQTVGCLEQGSGDFKVIKPEARHPSPRRPVLAVTQQEGPKESNACFFFFGSGEARDGPDEVFPEQCSLPIFIGLDAKCFYPVSSSPSEGSCIISTSSPRGSSSDCSGHSGSSHFHGVNLELSLSIPGS